MADFTFSRWILFLKPNRLFQLLSLTVQAKTELSPARYLLALWRKDLPDTYGDWLCMLFSLQPWSSVYSENLPASRAWTYER